MENMIIAQSLTTGLIEYKRQIYMCCRRIMQRVLRGKGLKELSLNIKNIFDMCDYEIASLTEYVDIKTSEDLVKLMENIMKYNDKLNKNNDNPIDFIVNSIVMVKNSINHVEEVLKQSINTSHLNDKRYEATSTKDLILKSDIEQFNYNLHCEDNEPEDDNDKYFDIDNVKDSIKRIKLFRNDIMRHCIKLFGEGTFYEKFDFEKIIKG